MLKTSLWLWLVGSIWQAISAMIETVRALNQANDHLIVKGIDRQVAASTRWQARNQEIHERVDASLANAGPNDHVGPTVAENADLDHISASMRDDIRETERLLGAQMRRGTHQLAANLIGWSIIAVAALLGLLSAT